MTDFFLWRGCDLSDTTARQAIMRNADVLNRGVALLGKDTGLPEDESLNDLGPSLDVASAEWGDPTAGGALPPGSYDYKLVPIDTCTGRTGVPISMPSLTLSSGQRANLRVSLNSKPSPCTGVYIQRNGLILGRANPVAGQVIDNVPVVRTPATTGTFVSGTSSTFTRQTGADLIVGDAITYQGKTVQVSAVAGNNITISPPVSLNLPPPPPGYFDPGARVGPYSTSLGALTSLPLGLPILPSTLTSFSTLLLPGVLCFPQLGDVILFGDKTAIVYGTFPSLITLGLVDVGVIPFGALPIPPLPIGLFFLVFRPIGNQAPGINNGIGQVSDAPAAAPTTTAFSVAGNPPTDPTITVGLPGHPTTIVVSGETKQILSVAPDGGAHSRVTLANAVTTAPAVNSLYLVIPQGLSPFLTAPVPAPSGSYTRLSRLVSITTQSNLWQFPEDGSLQDRSGTIGSAGPSARNTLDNIMTQAGYKGGLTGLFSKLRGPTLSSTNRTFNDTLGTLVLPTGARRLLAVNDLAKAGNRTAISLDNIRKYRDLLCGSFSNLNEVMKEVALSGLIVERFESRLVTENPAACPPGQPPTTSAQLFCLGPATRAVKPKEGETLRVFLSTTGKTATTTRQSLMLVGLTADEALNAINLKPTGRVIDVVEIVDPDIADIVDVADLGTLPQVDEFLDDPRITFVNPGFITRDQISLVLRKRGHAGIAKRPVTDALIDDFMMLASKLTALVLANQFTFDICDFAAAISSIPPGPVRTAVAAVFALVEAGLNHLVQCGQAFQSFLDNNDFVKAAEAIAGIIAAIAADPTLNCLIGPLNQSGFALPNIPQVDQFLQLFAFPFQARLQLSQLFGQAIQTILCSIIGGLLSLLPTDLAAAAQRAIGCLPSLGDLALAGFQFPSLDIQITIECSLTQLQTLLDIITELIAEANEVIDFLNSFGSGFVYSQVEARNKMCSGNESITDLFGQAASALGLDPASLGIGG